jgi:hypothetical protein
MDVNKIKVQVSDNDKLGVIKSELKQLFKKEEVLHYFDTYGSDYSWNVAEKLGIAKDDTVFDSVQMFKTVLIMSAVNKADDMMEFKKKESGRSLNKSEIVFYCDLAYNEILDKTATNWLSVNRKK